MAISRLSLIALIVVTISVASGVSSKLSAKEKSPQKSVLAKKESSSLGRRRSTISGTSLQNQYTEYDTLVIATEWSGSVCQIKSCNAGRPANTNFFNVHGLWPNVLANFSQTPFDCNDSTVSISSLPMDVQTSLKYYWNSLYTPAESFLNHEWGKHGTCWNPKPDNFDKVPEDLKTIVSQSQGCMSDELNHQISYIKTSIAVAQKYNVFAALASQGILPNSQRIIHKDEFLKAMLNSLKVSKYEVICQRNKSGVSLLYEVRICLDKNYNPMDCFALKYNCPLQWVYPEYA